MKKLIFIIILFLFTGSAIHAFEPNISIQQPIELNGNRFVTLCIMIRTTPWEVSRIGPAFLGIGYPHFHGIAYKVFAEFVYHLGFPDIGYPAETIQFNPFIEVYTHGVHYFAVTKIESPAFVCFDGANATPVVEAVDAVSGLSAAAGEDKVHRPAVEVDAINEILFALGRFNNLEIKWFFNKEFRLALLRDWHKKSSPAYVIDFTRYDLPAHEPADPTPDKPVKDWSLINVMNQKGLRPQDEPKLIEELTINDKDLIRKYYPELFEN